MVIKHSDCRDQLRKNFKKEMFVMKFSIRNTCKKLITIGISSFMMLGVISGSALGVEDASNDQWENSEEDVHLLTLDDVVAL